MSIIFLGNTTADFSSAAPTADFFDDVAAPLHDTDYVTSSINIDVDENTSVPFGFSVDTPSDDFWLQFRCKTGTLTQGGNRGAFRWMRFYDANEREVASVTGTAQNVHVTVYGDTTVASAGIDFPGNVEINVCVHIERNGTVDSTITLYFNGAVVCRATAANTTAGSLGVARTLFENFNMIQTNGTRSPMYYCEFIATDAESCLGWRIAILDAASDGFYTDFEGGFAEVSDSILATAAAGTNAGDRQTFVPGTYLGPATTAGIRSLALVATAAKGDIGPGTLRQSVRIASTDYDGDAVALSVNNGVYVQLFDNNPNTLLPWNTANFATLEFGVLAET